MGCRSDRRWDWRPASPYIVGASDREQAIAAVLRLLGPNTTITSSSRVPIEAFGISNVQPGEVIPL
jgi:hypothetical protein